MSAADFWTIAGGVAAVATAVVSGSAWVGKVIGRRRQARRAQQVQRDSVRRQEREEIARIAEERRAEQARRQKKEKFRQDWLERMDSVDPKWQIETYDRGEEREAVAVDISRGRINHVTRLRFFHGDKIVNYPGLVEPTTFEVTWTDHRGEQRRATLPFEGVARRHERT